MSADDARDLEVDQMLFLAAVIEDELDGLAVMTDPVLTEMFSVAGLSDGVAEICRANVASAQARLDWLIAEDTTWRPA